MGLLRYAKKWIGVFCCYIWSDYSWSFNNRFFWNSYPAMIIKTDWLELLPYKSLDIKGEDYPKMIDCEDLLDSGKFQKQ